MGLATRMVEHGTCSKFNLRLQIKIGLDKIVELVFVLPNKCKKDLSGYKVALLLLTGAAINIKFESYK